MFNRFKRYLFYTFFSDFISDIDSNHSTEISNLRQTLQKYEDLLANRNASCTQAQALYVTNHAIHRYRERIGFGGSDDELRKMIYKLTIRHLATMDKLPDGYYKINDKAAVRISNNTVSTVIPANKVQS